MAAPRPDMVQSAVTFLRDQSVGSSPLAKRIAFLEAKGLTQREIDEALRMVSSPSSFGNAPRYGSGPAQQLGRDWRDWFIMTVVGGSVGYLVVALARKYLMPALQPPTESQLAEAQAALTAKYDEAAAILQGLQTETEAVKASMVEQSAKVDGGIEDLRKAVEELRAAESKRDELVNGCREEVEAIRDLLPKMVEKQQDSQASALNDLQQELKSLKSILLSRRAAATAPGPSSATNGTANGASMSPSASGELPPRSTSGSPSPFPGLASRPSGIPAWQLGPSSTNTNTTAPAKETEKPTTNGVNGTSEAEQPSVTT